jgi:CPA2 family monovalent cation:H+ antiporter-2
MAGWDVCVLDLSPVNLYPFAQVGFRTVAGDATDASALERARVGRAALVIVSVPEDGVAIRVVQAVRASTSQARVVVRCRYQANVPALRKAGAGEVISEEIEAAGALLGAIVQL